MASSPGSSSRLFYLLFCDKGKDYFYQQVYRLVLPLQVLISCEIGCPSIVLSPFFDKRKRTFSLLFEFFTIKSFKVCTGFHLNYTEIRSIVPNFLVDQDVHLTKNSLHLLTENSPAIGILGPVLFK